MRLTKVNAGASSSDAVFGDVYAQPPSSETSNPLGMLSASFVQSAAPILPPVQPFLQPGNSAHPLVAPLAQPFAGVPEPSTFAVVGLGIFIVGYAARKFRKITL
jgi:hypothetical protein